MSPIPTRTPIRGKPLKDDGKQTSETGWRRPPCRSRCGRPAVVRAWQAHTRCAPMGCTRVDAHPATASACAATIFRRHGRTRQQVLDDVGAQRHRTRHPRLLCACVFRGHVRGEDVDDAEQHLHRPREHLRHLREGHVVVEGDQGQRTEGDGFAPPPRVSRQF